MSTPDSSVPPALPPFQAAPAGGRSPRGELWALLGLAVPAIAAQVTQFSMKVIDTLMAGRLGSDALAAVGVGGNVWMPLGMGAMGVLFSVSPSIAQAWGAGDRDECRRIGNDGLWLAGLMSLVLLSLLQVAPGLMRVCGVAESLILPGMSYVRATSLGVPAWMLFIVLRGVCDGAGQTRPILFASLIGSLVNVTGNAALMFGWWGFPRLGVVGCGLATALAQWSMLLWLLAWLRWQAPRGLVAPPRLGLPRLNGLGHLVQVGVPIAISLFLEVSCFAFSGLFIGRLGETAVAANQIALNLASLTYMVPLGISLALCVRVGQWIGAGQPRQARLVGLLGMGACVAVMLLAAAAFLLCPLRLARLYTDSPEVIAATGQLLALAGLFQVFDGLQCAAGAALRGLKQTRLAMVVTLLAYWVVGLPLGLWLGLGRGWGAAGFWAAFIVSLGFAGLALAFRFLRAVDHWPPAPAPVAPQRVA